MKTAVGLAVSAAAFFAAGYSFGGGWHPAPDQPPVEPAAVGWRRLTIVDPVPGGGEGKARHHVVVAIGGTGRGPIGRQPPADGFSVELRDAGNTSVTLHVVPE